MTKQEMLNKIKAADKAYYDDDSPIMTDKEYDTLRSLFIIKYGKKALDYVPGGVKTEFDKYRHPVPLLSLGKVHDDDPEAEKKLQRFVDKVGYKNILIEPKIDGITIAAVLKDESSGECQFVTRGRGGIEGEILPRFISKYSGKNANNTGCTVRGEAFIMDSNFNKILEIQKNNGEKPFANSRNAVAGILRNIDGSPFVDYLSYIAYEIPGSNKDVFYQLERIEFGTAFMTVPAFGYNNREYGFTNISSLKESLQKFYNDWIEGDVILVCGLKSSEIPIDGLVLKYNLDGSYEKFGVTGHHPNNALAWKKTADEYETQVRDITWQVGRDSVTPVAELEPIDIDGTTVSRATLHNLGFFNRMALSAGDTVVICKSGEIIPKILRVSQRGEGERFEAPDSCPSCGFGLVATSRIEKDGREVAELCCENPECPQRVAQNIAFLASKDVLDIRGLSASAALKIVEANAPCDETVIFSLSAQDIESLPKFAKVSADNLYTAIKAAQDKRISLSLLVKAACVTGIGNTIGKILEDNFKTLDNILSLTRESLSGINGIGPKTIDVLTSDEFKRKLKSISECLNYQEADEEEEEKENLAASGTVWVITGKFIVGDRHITRDEIVKMIESIGGTVENSVTKDTDYLLVSSKDTVSSKAQKAKKYGTRIVTFGFLQGLLMS